jgi:hypothetical protein
MNIFFKKIIFISAILFGTHSFGSEKYIQLSPSEMGKNFIEMPILESNQQKKFVKVWLLQDFHKIQNGAKSMRAINEFDCIGKSVRVLRLAVYLSTMGTDLITEFDNSPKQRMWISVPENTFGDEAMKLVCKTVD